MEIVGLVFIAVLVGCWVVGSRRQRGADEEQRQLLEQLEGQHIRADVVVGRMPGTRAAQIVAPTSFVLGSYPTHGSRVRVADVRVTGKSGIDRKAISEELERDGLDVRDILTVTAPDGDLFDFGTVRQARTRRRDPQR